MAVTLELEHGFERVPDRAARENGIGDIARADHPPFAALLPYGPVVGDPDDGVILLQEPNNPRDAALGCMWKVQPRNVGAIADEAVTQMAAVLQGLFRSLLPGTAIQVLMHMAPTDEVRRWTDFRKDAPDIYSLNEFQQASIREGLAHADGAKRWRLRTTTTLVTARLSAPVPDLRHRQRALSLLQPERTLLRHMNRLTETVLAQVLAELAELRVLCESVLDMAGVRHQRLDCAAMHREISRLLQPWQRQPRCYDPEVPMREQLLSVPARTTMQGAWVFGPDETDPEREHAWQARVMSLQQAPPRTFPGILSSLHAPPDTEPFAPWEALPDMPLTLVTQVGVPDQADERALLRQKRNFAYLQRNTALGEEDPEKVRLREDLDRIMKDTTSHILHTRVHLVLWGRADRSLASTASVLTQSARRLDLEFLPEDILGHQLFLQSLPLGLNLKYPRDRMLRRSRRISSLAAAHLLAAVRRLHRQRDAGAALRQPARRGGHLRPVRRHHRGPHHRGGQVAFRQILPGEPSHPAGAAPGQFGGHPGQVGVLRHHLRGVQGRVRRDRPRQAGVLQPVRRRPGVRAPHLPDGAHRPDGLRGVRPGRRGAGADRQGGVLAGIAGVRRVAPGKPARPRAAAQGLLRPAAPPAVRGRRAGGGHRAAHRPVRRQGRVRRLRGRPERTAAEQQPGRLRAGQARQGQRPAIRACCSPSCTASCRSSPTRRRASQRKYLILDEVWALLKHDSAAAFLEEAARALARFRCCAIFMSQQLSDFNSAAAQAIKNNSGNYLFLQQNPEEIGTVKELFNLSEQEARLLALVHKRETWGEGYLWQPEGAGGVIRLVPDPFLRWLASQKPHEKGARERLRDELGGDLTAAVSHLARQYPVGLPQSMAG